MVAEKKRDSMFLPCKRQKLLEKLNIKYLYISELITYLHRVSLTNGMTVVRTAVWSSNNCGYIQSCTVSCPLQSYIINLAVL